MINSGNLRVAQMLAPVTAATTERTANIDTQGASFCSIIVDIGVELNTNATGVSIDLSESDDTVVTNFATFDADFNQDSIDNSSATFAVNHIDLRGRKRYLRLTVTPDTTTNGTVITSAKAILDDDVKSATAADYGSNVVWAE